MKIAEIDFPSPLLSALRDGELVIFAGAGVSMGEPACLPSFKELAEKIAQGTDKRLQDGETEDRFLGRLHDKGKGVKVHKLAVQELSRNNPKPTDLHRDLLRLYRKEDEQVRVVTTNFDLLFEEAAQDVFGAVPEVFRAPALPLGRDFNGIVHVHGALSHLQGMVLTDEDFGRAYLTEGWARRFLVELFRNFPVLFVGYRHKDIILNYLARALPIDSAKPRFALTDDSDLQRWKSLGIEPFLYSQLDANDHSRLYEGVRRLAEYVNRGVLDWQREITDLAEKPPPSLDEEAADLIADSLSDAVRTRFFTQAATSPKWIDWLNNRGHLDPLFGPDNISEPSAVLATWLAENFAHDQAYKLFLLISQHQMQLNPSFWYQLQWAIGKEEKPLDENTLSRWVSLLLETAPADMNWPMWLEISKRCNDQKLMSAILQIFAAMSKSRLLLEPGFTWPSDDGDNQPSSIDVDLPLICDLHILNELWEKGLKPNLAQVAEPLLSLVVRYFEDRHRTLSMWQQPDEGDYIDRSAIESHAQDISVEDIDILTDAARDSLEWLASNHANVGATWCDLLITSDIPRLRRLAVHTLSVRSDLTADAKIDWLLTQTHIGLHDLEAHHETFQAMKQTYPNASPEQREKLIEAVLAYRWPSEDDPEREEYTAYEHFKWLSWLHAADRDCPLAETKLKEIWEAYPEFKPEHPDFVSWMGPVEFQSPWSVEELLARPAGEWLRGLLSFHSTDPFNDPLLQRAVGDAAKQELKWGLDLAEALASRENWETNLWSSLIHSWSRTELDDKQGRAVLNLLDNANLYQEHGREVALMLYALVENGGMPCALELLPQANKIAAALWANLDHDQSWHERSNWLNSAAGTITLFWLGSLVLWRRRQDLVPRKLDGEYLAALSKIVEDQTIARRPGKTILAGQFAFLLAIDENWTKENLLPLFFKENHRNTADYKAIWDGFLTMGRFTPSVAELLSEAFLKAVPYINSDLSDRRDRFIKAYVTMIGYYVKTPIKKWISKFFTHSDAEARHTFADEIGDCLLHMDETQQQEHWNRWLKRYWQNRLEGVPKRLESDEIKRMMDWLPHLTGVFPEAVDLAIQMPEVQWNAGWMLHRLEKGELPDAHPEAMARLVICLDLPHYAWYEGRKLIAKLLQSPLPPDLKTKLQELDAKLTY